MKKIILSLIFIFILNINLFSMNLKSKLNEWTWQNTLLQIGFITLTSIEWKQNIEMTKWHTKSSYPIIIGEQTYVIKHMTKYNYNANPFLKDASLAKINTYFITYILAHTGITFLLPLKYKPILQLAGIFIEADITLKNYSAGIRFKY